MIISNSRKFIFIHVYKVAGTSIKEALGNYKDELSLPYTIIKRVLKINPKFHRDPSKWSHQTALEVKNLVPKKYSKSISNLLLSEIRMIGKSHYIIL
jgi:hypothetical protein